jgi:Undecaprenyl-phosphate glucose phosphotransferase
MKSKETELQLIFLILDLVLLNTSLLLWREISPFHSIKTSLDLSLYLFHANLSWMVTNMVVPPQNIYLRDYFKNKAFNIIKRFAWFMVIGSVVTFFLMPKSYSRLFFIHFSVLFFLFELLFYWIVYKELLYRRKKGIHLKRTVIVGVTKTSKLLKTVMENNPILGYKFLGFVAENEDQNESNVIGRTDDLLNVIENNRVEIVFVSSTLFRTQDDPYNYLKICKWMGTRLFFLQESYLWKVDTASPYAVGEISLLNPEFIPMDDLGARILKRLFDLIFSSIVIVGLLSWAVPLVALLIKLSSKGPVFFIQRRTGINNRSFNCIKFRSMQINGDAHRLQASSNDPRITKIGKFLRRTNLDELPQFFNVWGGQMSVVGPRPHMLKHTDEYSRLIEYYKTRHYVKPGITGWAQVNGFRGETNELWKMEKRVEYDMAYLYKWSFWWDISIIFRTIFNTNSYKNSG